MIVRELSGILGGPLDVRALTWRSRRLITAADGVGFSVHDTIVYAGTETNMHYRNHVEAVYCIDGEGELVDLGSGRTLPIGIGTIYALDNHDRHLLRAVSDLRLVCVFTPPLAGPEVHDAEGGYPPAASL